MKLSLSKSANKQVRKLPPSIQKKTQKAFKLLMTDSKHPSLHARKKRGTDVYEARIDYQYRFTYIFNDENFYILTVGPHDT